MADANWTVGGMALLSVQSQSSRHRRSASRTGYCRQSRSDPPLVHQVRYYLYTSIEAKTPGLRGHLHIDEVFVKINGKQHYLWRAVDQDCEGGVFEGSTYFGNVACDTSIR